MSALTVVFDLDGTLVDTAPDLVATLNTIIMREGMAEVPFDIARNMVGAGARRMIELAVARAGRSLPPQEAERLYQNFIAYYRDHIADQSKPYPGVVAALDRLAERHCQFAVCTNKLEGLSVLLLEKLGLRNRFGAICGQDTFGMAKPDPEILRRTIARVGGRPERAVLVGDSPIDIQTAKAAAVPVVAIDFGYSDIPVSQLEPDRVISHFNRLAEAVFTLRAENA